jgi:hypothetical protein
MFDIARTIALIRGGLFDPTATWEAYHAENRSWQDTAMILTIPMIVITMVFAGILSLLFSGFYAFPRYGGFGQWLSTFIWLLVGFMLTASIFTFLAGVFKGRADMNRGVAALSLASLPSYAGIVLGTLPMLGWLFSLGLGILGLVFFYRIIPLYLKVPDDKRAVHFIVSLVATSVVAVLLGMIFGVGMMNNDFQTDRGIGSTGGRSGGFLGDISRQGEIYESAMKDTYEPPENGRLTDDQVREYLRVMESVRSIQEKHAARLKQMAREMEDKDEPDLSDISKVYAGMSSVMGVSNAPMEVVKSRGGNWAEHVWVEDQLRIARYQPELSDAARDNAGIYQKHAEQLEALGNF